MYTYEGIDNLGMSREDILNQHRSRIRDLRTFIEERERLLELYEEAEGQSRVARN